MYAYADVVLDNKTKAGDAILSDERIPAKFCAVSGVTSIALLHSLMAETIEQLLERDVIPPIFVAANVDGGEEYNARMIEKYRDRIFYLMSE